MEKVRILMEGQEVKIPYNEKIAHGIFLVNEDNVAFKNARLLRINLEQQTENTLLYRTSKFPKTCILSIKTGNACVQYVFKEYALREEVEKLAKEYDDSPVGHHMRQAYNMAKMNTLGDLGLLDTLGNVN